MNTKAFRYHLAKAIMQSTDGLEYDDVETIVRLIAPELQGVIARKEQQINAEKAQKKKPTGNLDYVKVL